MKAGPDGNHGFLLRRAVHIRQSAWGVAPRHPRRRLTGLAPWPSGILRSACSADRLASDTTRRRNVVRSQLAVAPGPTIALQLPCRGRVRVPPGRHRLDEPRHRLLRHGRVPNASMDARSMSTTITFRSDGAGPRSHWSPAAWTTLLPASQRSPRFVLTVDYGPFSASHGIITRALTTLF